MRLRWPTHYLPGFPAILLVLAVLGLWAQLCFTESKYDWAPHRLPGMHVYRLRHEEGEPWYNPRGFPFAFSGSWEEVGNIRGVATYGWTGFQITWFLGDLIIALTAAYIFAMGVERLVFPLVQRQYRTKPKRGEHYQEA